jgi:autotransporter-associated beta strand protein
MKIFHPKSTGIPAFARNYAPQTQNRMGKTLNRSLPKILFSVVILILISPLSKADTKTATVSGNWSSTATWGGGVIPISGDDVTINSGVTVTVDLANISCSSLNIIAGGTLDLNGFDFSSGALTGNGILTNSGTTCVFTTGSKNKDTTFPGNITGSLDLTKIGTKKLTLTGINSYTGLTIISNGTLMLGSAATNSTIVGNILINGGVLDYSTDINEQISNSSEVQITSGTYDISRTETIGSLIMTGGSLNRGGGKITLTNASSITGGTILFSSKTAKIETGSSLVIGNATFEYNSANDGTNTLNLGGSITYESTNVSPAIFRNSDKGIGELQIGNGGTRIFNIEQANHSQPEIQIAWKLTQGSGTTSLEKNGTGTMLLSGLISYKGATTITEGELRINPSTNLAPNTPFILNGGKLSTTGINSGISIVNSGTLKLDANSIIDLGANPHTIHFADSHSITWSGNLTISNWTGKGGKLYFGNSSGGLTAGQLANISFTGYTGTPILLSTGELVPSNGTWLGTANNDWNNAANWGNNVLPDASTDVRIPSGLTNYPVIASITTADCNDLSIASGATLTIDSDASGSGSLIMAGIYTGPGQVTYNRYLNDRWHLVSSPVAAGNDQSVSTFLANAANSIYRPSNPSANQYEMVIYKEETDSWQYYEDELGAGGYFNTHPNFLNGAGYGLLRSAAGKVAFTGSLPNSDVSASLVKTANGWNLVGNPFPSVIKANDASGDATTNFLKLNLSNLDPNYAAIYLWEEGSDYNGETNYFRVITNGIDPIETPGDVSPAQNFIQAGQGFFVKAAINGGSVLFSRAMQSHSVSTPLKSAKIDEWYGLQLNVSNGENKAHTIIAFNKDMSKGLDISYDAGLLNSGNGLEVYTRLIEDNGIDFAVQALPDSEMEQIAIPLGIDYETGGKLTISADIRKLPDGETIVLEDQLTGMLTDLSTDTYSVSLPPGSKGTGRFYLYVSRSGMTGLTPVNKKVPPIEIWSDNGSITIQGKLSRHAIARLFDLQGKLLIEKNLNDTQLNQITSPVTAKGIYFIKIIDGRWETTKKMVIN